MARNVLNKKTISTIVVIIAALTLIIVLLISQNAALSKSNEELSKSTNSLLKTNQELSAKFENTTRQLEALQRNYTEITRFFGGDSNPLIQTRLGITLIERYDTNDNYLWVTGEVENMENVTGYDVKLNFKLYTYSGTDDSQILIGTMQPHQVVTIRTSVTTPLRNIINWTVEPAATFVPSD